MPEIVGVLLVKLFGSLAALHELLFPEHNRVLYLSESLKLLMHEALSY
jgi:hypothetical protein